MSLFIGYYFVYVTLFHTVCSVAGILWSGNTFRRQVSLEINPGLAPRTVLPRGVSVLHARAVGPNDTLHILLCSGGAPALLLVHTHSIRSAVKVNWHKFLSTDPKHSVTVEPESSVQYQGALVFTRLWEYDELNSTGQSVLSPYELQEFEWDDVNKTVDYTHLTAQLCGRHSNISGHAHLCLHVSVVLNDIMPRTNQSHFGLELQTVNEAGLWTRVDVHRSIDDEYTPSIFQVSEWVWFHDNSSSVVGFSQWKPVVYKQTSPTTEDAAPCSHSEPVVLPKAPPSRIVLAYFTQNSLIHALNITFNLPSDPNPNSTHYLSWTLMAGIGTPPSDFFSSLVIAIMAICLGMPLLLLLVGGVFICVRRWKLDSLGHYESIN